MDNAKLNWLRAGVLGANDGIVSISVLLVSIVGVLPWDKLFIVGVSAILAGAFSMAVGEYISVGTQRDAEEANDMSHRTNPLHAALSSFGAFLIGSTLPLTAALIFENILAIIIAVVVAFVITTTVSVKVGKTDFRKNLTRNLTGGGIGLAVGILLNTLVFTQ